MPIYKVQTSRIPRPGNCCKHCDVSGGFFHPHCDVATQTGGHSAPVHRLYLVMCWARLGSKARAWAGLLWAWAYGDAEPSPVGGLGLGWAWLGLGPGLGI
jgi:hypothetical protein